MEPLTGKTLQQYKNARAMMRALRTKVLPLYNEILATKAARGATVEPIRHEREKILGFKCDVVSVAYFIIDGQRMEPNPYNIIPKTHETRVEYSHAGNEFNIIEATHEGENRPDVTRQIGMTYGDVRKFLGLDL